MKSIIINSKTHGKHEVLFDDEDENNILQYKWCVIFNCGYYYAKTSIFVNGKQYSLLMHRYILGLNKVDGILADHADFNGLNNQKNNIRKSTQAQNRANCKKKQGKTSKYLGVDIRKDCKIKPFRVSISVNNKTVTVGQYANEIDAAKAYNEAAIKYHGEFANLNIID